MFAKLTSVLLSLSILATVLNATGKDKGKAVVVKKEDDEVFNEFTFRGSIEPKIEREYMEKLKQYEVTVFSKTTRMDNGLQWRRSMTIPTGHQFSVPLRFRRKYLKEKESIKSKLKKNFLPEKWQGKQHESCNSSTGVEQIRVQVKAYFRQGNDKVMTRTWLIVEPDFSLHYELNVGVLEGENYWFKAKITLPPGIRLLLPEDEFEITSFGKINNTQFGLQSYGGIERWKEKSQLKNTEITMHGNIMNIAFKLDGKLINNFLSEFPEKPTIKFSFKRNEFGEKLENKVWEELIDTLRKKEEERIHEEKVKVQSKMTEKDEIKQRNDERINGEKHKNKAETSGSAAESPDCTICLIEIEEGEAWQSQNCGHRFHKDCIMKCSQHQMLTQLQMICPICRRPFRKEFTFLIEDPVFSNGHHNYSFEYQYTAPESNDEESIVVEKEHEFCEENGSTEEQMEFFRLQYTWMPIRNELHAIPLEQSRLKTVKVTRLEAIGDAKGKQKEVSIDKH